MTTVEEDSAIWQELTQKQDELVISLLLSKQQFLAGIAPAPVSNGAETAAAAAQEIERLQQEVQRLRQVSWSAFPECVA